MRKELFNENGVYFAMEYNAKKGWVYADFIGYLTLEEAKKAAASIPGFITEMGASKLLIDNTRQEGSWDELNDWVANTWMPRILESGVKRYGHVLSKDVFTALSAEELSRSVHEYNFEFQMFGTKEEAEEWLTEVTA